MKSIKRAGYLSGAHISTQPEFSTVTRQRLLLRMNTYRVVLGCVVIICYLQQHGWAAPSQIENVQPSIQQTQVNNQLQEDILEDAINQALLNLPKARSHIQKRQTLSSLFEMIRQNMRNTLYPQFFCAASELRTDMRVNYFEVSNTMHEYISS